MRRMLLMTLMLLPLAAGALGQSPAVTKHPASWLASARGNLFFCLNGDGSQLLVNRSPSLASEELVVVPSSGGEGVLWHAAVGRSIYDRIVLSGDGTTVAFARTDGSKVYALPRAMETPRVVADVSPDADPRQLRISDDGTWVAFTAARMVQSGTESRVHANLYVAATDGSALHRITAVALPDRYIAFDLSGDGQSIVWLDDATKGPLVADRDGGNSRRIGVTPQHLGPVRCNANASLIYFEAFDREGKHLWRVNRDGTGEAKLHSTTSGQFFVARGSGQVRLEKFDPQATPPGVSWMLSGGSPTKMCDLQRPDIVGASAWSDDGSVFVWRAPASPGVCETFVWRVGS
ncbi:MAG: hypothetical protein JW940_12730 [Polyangiaceae bacterium]|nr:hypothetical protein [Polyangiaceae bacterium]